MKKKPHNEPAPTAQTLIERLERRPAKPVVVESLGVTIHVRTPSLVDITRMSITAADDALARAALVVASVEELAGVTPQQFLDSDGIKAGAIISAVMAELETLTDAKVSGQ